MKNLVIIAMLAFSSVSFAEGVSYDYDCAALAESETRVEKKKALFQKKIKSNVVKSKTVNGNR